MSGGFVSSSKYCDAALLRFKFSVGVNWPSFFASNVQLQPHHLCLLSRTEYRTCVVFLMQDYSTRRVYRLYDFTKSQQITPDHCYCVSGKVNSADKRYLVIESLKMDTQHHRSSTTPVPC